MFAFIPCGLKVGWRPKWSGLLKSVNASKTLKGTYRFLDRYLTLRKALLVWASLTVTVFLTVLINVYALLPSAPPGETWYVFKIAVTSSANLLIGRENQQTLHLLNHSGVLLSGLSLFLLIGILFAANRSRILAWIYGQVDGGYLVYGNGRTLHEIEKKARGRNCLVLRFPEADSPEMPFWEAKNNFLYRFFKIVENKFLGSAKNSRKTPGLTVGVMRRTSEVFAISENDLSNISFVNELLKKGLDKNKIHFTIHISNNCLRKQVAERLVSVPYKKIESIYDRFARKVALFQPPDSLRFISRPLLNHAVVIGETAQGSALAKRLISQSARSHRGTFQLTLVDSVENTKISTWAIENAESIPFLSLKFLDLVSDNESSVISLLEYFRRNPPTAIYFTAGSSDKNIALGFSLARKMEDLSLSFPRFFICVDDRKDADNLQGLMTSTERLYFNFLCADLETDTNHVGTEVDHFDHFPSVLHTNYLKTCLERGESIGVRPSLRSWDDLPENYKEDNRNLADHFLQKCRDQGLFVKASKNAEHSYPLITDSETRENFAIAEHKRWWINKAQEGWVYGDIRNDSAKIHPDMVEWTKLPSEVKLKDYNATIPILKRPGLYGLEIKKNIYIRVRSVENLDSDDLTPEEVSIIARQLTKQISSLHGVQDRKVVVVGSLKVYQDVLLLGAICDLLPSPLALIEYPEFLNDVEFHSPDKLLICEGLNELKKFCYLFFKVEARVKEVDKETLKEALDFSSSTDLIDLEF